VYRDLIAGKREKKGARDREREREICRRCFESDVNK